MSVLKTLTINGTTYNVTPIVPASSVTLLASAWTGEGDLHSQVVEIPGVTPRTKVDLQPTAEQLEEFYYKILAFSAENDEGVVTVYAIGDRPLGDHTIQITLTEVEGEGKIRGNTVGTPTPRSDWNQTNPRKADYIANKPDVEGMLSDLRDQMTGDIENFQEQMEDDMSDLQDRVEEAEAIAKGRATGYVFDTADDLDAWLSDPANSEKLLLGDNLYIRATDVPDYWWDGTHKQQLETQKVDLSEYVKNTDFATGADAGVVMVDMRYGSRVVNGILDICAANNSLIDGRTANKNSLYSAGQYSRHTIVPSNVDYAVKKALADNKLVDTENAWTEEEKTAARELLGAVGNTDYATKDKAGLVKTDSSYSGISVGADGNLQIYGASEAHIKAKNSGTRPITPLRLDLAVKTGITTNTIELTDEEKKAACSWMGAMRAESWTVDVKSGETSEPHTCSGTVVAVFATILTSHGHKVSALWTPNTSGMIDQFYGGEPNGPMTYYTIVDIDGADVTVTAVHRDNTYYMTALIV